MSDPDKAGENDSSDSPSPDARGRRFAKITGGILSVGLLAAAVWFVLSRSNESIDTAVAALAHPDWVLLGLYVVCVVGNLFVSGVMFTVLIRPFGRVGFMEMQWLITSTALVNYLPLRPGLFGRIAYHRVVNDIPVRHGTMMALSGVLASALASGAGAAALIIAAQLDWSLPVVFAGVAGLMCAFAAAVPGRLLAGREHLASDLMRRLSLALAVAIALRFADILLWSIRYLLVFSLVDRSIGFETALAFACISMLATMVPFISNGLGLREWAIGLAAPLLTVDLGSEVATLADLVNRGIEVLVVLVIGSIALTMVTRRVQAARKASQSTKASSRSCDD